MPLGQFVAEVPRLLAEIQQGLFERARAFRESRTVRLASRAELLDYFGQAADSGKGGAAAGFAHLHVADDPAVGALLDPLKVTVRCVPMDGSDEPGACVVTGQPVARRSVLARSY